MERFRTIAITHKSTELKDIGRLHIADEQVASRLKFLKEEMGIGELIYLSTCNRVEFIMVAHVSLSKEYLTKFFTAFNPQWNQEYVNWAATQCKTYEGQRALEHLFYVSSSVDSLVVGEREIITQVRQAYENCTEYGLTGDSLRLLIKRTVETAKRIYTETQIAQNPVSVVSLAYRKMRQQDIEPKPRIIMIGAGQTNQTMGQYLRKAPYSEMTVYNRTLSKAKELADLMNGNGHALSELNNHKKGFDIIITCTGSDYSIVDIALFKKLVGNDNDRKIIVDLAIPSDIDDDIRYENVTYIGIADLKDEARRNLQLRQSEMEKCKRLITESIVEFEGKLRRRKVELAMQDVPVQVKAIKEKALNEVFNKEMESLDENSKEVLEKVIQYIEKKYISGPMKLAKEIMTKDE
jgi:glutamyl-tRNA reductase